MFDYVSEDEPASSRQRSPDCLGWSNEPLLPKIITTDAML